MVDLMIGAVDVEKETITCKRCNRQFPRFEEYQIVVNGRMDGPYCWECFKELTGVGKREVVYGKNNDND